MEREKSKAETGKKHFKRNDFIIEKQHTELEHREAKKSKGMKL